MVFWYRADNGADAFDQRGRTEEELRQLFLEDFQELPDFANVIASVAFDVVAEPSP